MSREFYYFYISLREMQLCMAALAYQLVQIPDVEWVLRNELSKIVERMAEEIAK